MNDDYDSLWRDAAKHGRAGRLDEAESLARHALARIPTRPEAFVVLAAIAECRNRTDEAQEYLRAALVFAPMHPPAHASLARLTRLGAARAPLWGDE